MTWSLLQLLLMFFMGLAFPCVVLLLLAVAMYFVLGSPLRREQRARFFLDLLEHGLRVGRSPEHTVTELSRSHDRSLGVRFHRLAAQLDQGLRLSQGLRSLRYFLPPQVVATLAVGEHLGDLGKVLPACRKLLTSASSQVTGAINYLVVILLVANPVILPIWAFLPVVVAPKLIEIGQEFAPATDPWLLVLLTRYRPLVIWFYVGTSVFLVALVLFYWAGPRLVVGFDPVASRLAWMIPWKRQRLLRHFSAILGVLLDSGVPERDGVSLAAASTANQVLIRLSGNVLTQLAQGLPLAQAVASLDHTGEFSWRLRNATGVEQGFGRALAGWQDSLAARSYAYEQVVSQTVSTGLVILNGVLIGLLAVGLFQMMTSIVWGMALW